MVPEMNEAKENSLHVWLFNPFLFVAGAAALGVGLVVVLLAGWLGSLSRSHFDGVLDFQTGAPAPLWFFLSEGIIAALCMGILLYVAGLIFSPSRIRFVDVVGTQFLARWPTLILALIALIPGYTALVEGFAREMLQSLAAGKSPAIPFATYWPLFLFWVVMTVVLVWMVALMWRAFAVSCNLRGGKGVVIFVVVLLVAEAASKVIILNLPPAKAMRPAGMVAPAQMTSAKAESDGATTSTLPSTTSASDLVSEKAKGLVQALVAGDMASATSQFDATMRSVLPADRLAGVWEETTADKGAFQGLGGVRKQKFQGYDVAFVTCRFEQGNFDVQVVLDGQGQVAGLFIRPEGFTLP